MVNPELSKSGGRRHDVPWGNGDHADLNYSIVTEYLPLLSKAQYYYLMALKSLNTKDYLLIIL